MYKVFIDRPVIVVVFEVPAVELKVTQFPEFNLYSHLLAETLEDADIDILFFVTPVTDKPTVGALLSLL